MSEPPFRLAIQNYFRRAEEYVKKKYTEQQHEAIRNNFPTYISYLWKNYYSENSQFPTSEWCHFQGTPTDLIQLSNTNMLESMNHALKLRYPKTGHIGLTRRSVQIMSLKKLYDVKFSPFLTVTSPFHIKLLFSLGILAKFYRSTMDDSEYFKRFGRLPPSRRSTIVTNAIRQEIQSKVASMMQRSVEEGSDPSDQILRFVY